MNDIVEFDEVSKHAPRHCELEYKGEEIYNNLNYH